MNQSRIYDVAIIGGGINGCGIARDAAGRGLSVLLCEQGDLAQATSSASTKLIHGGLRYLEYREFRLVREALKEREVLWRIAPHIIWPLRFTLPHHTGLRPAWLLRLGLFLYDNLGGRRQLPGSRSCDLTTNAAGQPLRKEFRRGFEYSDCWVEDARLVILNAMAAAHEGADIRVQTRCLSAEREGQLWSLKLSQAGHSVPDTIHARTLINAAGPWVGKVLANTVNYSTNSDRNSSDRNNSDINGTSESKTQPHIRMVQGSHIVVKRLFNHDGCYIFQNSDGRIVFAIPYETDFTLIGTTDRDYSGDPLDVVATTEEINYLCEAASAYFAEPVVPDQVVWTYSGVRPLYDDGASTAQTATRDYVLKLDTPDGKAPLLSIFGGKITTYRRLALAALEALAPYLPPATRRPVDWTASEPLPGGDFPTTRFGNLVTELSNRYPFLTPEHAQRLARAYGTVTTEILGSATTINDLGPEFGATLTGAEVTHLINNEWARSAADVVWRRSKLGLRLSALQIACLDSWISGYLAGKRCHHNPPPSSPLALPHHQE